MHLCRPFLFKALNARCFSPAAVAALQQDPTSVPDNLQLKYLEGHPRPDLKYAETIIAIPRSSSGKNISAKERKAGRLPSIVFEQESGQHGGNKRLISVQSNQIRKLVTHMGRSFFLSRLFDLEVRSEFESADIIEKVRILPRKLHLHAGTDAPLNITFIRAPSHALLKVDVPIVYVGEDVSPGLRKGVLSHSVNEIEGAMTEGGSSSLQSTNVRPEESVEFQTKLSTFLAFPYEGALSDYFDCFCRWDSEAMIVTNWEGDNKGRRERVCRRQKTYKGCGFQQWKDDEICDRGRAVIKHLYNALERSVAETVELGRYVSSLEDEVARLEALLGILGVEPGNGNITQ